MERASLEIPSAQRLVMRKDNGIVLHVGLVRSLVGPYHVFSLFGREPSIKMSIVTDTYINVIL